MSYRKILFTFLLSLNLALLVACSGGETGTGAQDNQQTTIGTITGFGSVRVNGVRFSTDASTNYQINNVQGDESDLAHGMVVAIVGTVDAGGVTGKATEIRYEHNMVGIVFDNTLLNVTPGTTMDAMGYTINVSADTVFESNDINYATLNTIPNGAVVEISGYRLISSDGIYATRIELVNAQYTAGQSVYVKGVINSVDEMASTFTLFGSSMVIDYSVADNVDNALFPNNIVSVELRIDAPSVPPADSDTYLATKIETFIPEEDDFSDGEEVEIEGVVTSNINTNTGVFTLNGLNVLVGDNVDFECANTPVSAIKEGMKLEVEGVFNSSKVLIADEIECRQNAEIEITAFVHAKDMDNNTFSLLGRSVHINDLTIIKDESSEQPDKEFSFSKLVVGDRVEISAHEDPTTLILTATNLVKTNNSGASQFEFEFSGPITDVLENSTNNNIADAITVAGVVFDVSDENPKVSSNVVGEIVEIEGSYDELAQPKLEVTSVSF